MTKNKKYPKPQVIGFMPIVKDGAELWGIEISILSPKEQADLKKKECPECRGRGTLIDRLEPCGECNGSGYIANGKEWCANESERSGDYPWCLKDCPDISVCPYKCS